MGEGFGFPTRAVGEVVFNTGMVGYPETLTDPSYRGQILTLTYPLIGNYGVPSYDTKDEHGLPRHFESDRIHLKGIAIHHLSRDWSHWNGGRSFEEWLYDEKVPGICGIDTRELTKRIRVRGVLMGVLQVSQDEPDPEELRKELDRSQGYGEINFVEEVSIGSPKEYGEGEPVALIDCGLKLSILRNLLERGFKVVRMPYDAKVDEILSYRPRGIVVSNGPGDPKRCAETVSAVRELLSTEMPVLGICLGLQMLTLAAGGDTFKLKFGHRGQNKPCVDLRSQRSYVTSQNHGYAADFNSLQSSGFELWFINADDKTVEGLRHRTEPWMAVQFHPEAAPGPYDTEYVFDEFSRLVKQIG